MRLSLLNDVRRILTLFAGFMIGMHLAVLFHELGHALGIWGSGGTVVRIVMQAPLPAGYVVGTAPSDLMRVWGGVVFGTFMTLPVLLTARCLAQHPSIRFAAMMTAAFCLGHNGMYLLIGSVIPFADASNMIALGAPRWLLFLLGAPVIAGFVVVLARAIQTVGLHSTESIWKWIFVVELGLLTFPAVMVGSMFFMAVPQAVRVPTIAFVACYAVCFCLGACRARAATAARNSEVEMTQMNQNWTATSALILSAMALVAVEWLTLRPPNKSHPTPGSAPRSAAQSTPLVRGLKGNQWYWHI